jgi:hypothetical protein
VRSARAFSDALRPTFYASVGQCARTCFAISVPEHAFDTCSPDELKTMVALFQRRFILFLMSMLCLACVARAQSGGGSVWMSGGVSETVALSIPQRAKALGDCLRVNTSRNADGSLTDTISGTTRDLTEVRIPVQIRSNTGYRLLAKAKAAGSNLSSVLVVGARPTGNLVFPEAVSVAAAFDGRRGANKLTPAGGYNRPKLSALSELLSGPRVSTGGTITSPHNALEVTLSVAVAPRAGGAGLSSCCFRPRPGAPSSCLANISLRRSSTLSRL